MTIDEQLALENPAYETAMRHRLAGYRAAAVVLISESGRVHYYTDARTFGDAAELIGAMTLATHGLCADLEPKASAGRTLDRKSPR